MKTDLRDSNYQHLDIEDLEETSSKVIKYWAENTIRKYQTYLSLETGIIQGVTDIKYTRTVQDSTSGSGVGCWLPLTQALRFHYLCLYCPVRLWFQLCIHTIVPGFLNIYPVFSQRFVGFSIQLLRLASYSRCWQ
jgi:hypothetical protein